MAELVPWEVTLEDGLLNAYLHGKLTVEGGVSVPLGQKILFGDGDTTIKEISDDYLGFYIDGARKISINADGLFGVYGTTPGAVLLSVLATNIVPSLIPSYYDFDTGIGTSGGDILSLIAGGVEGIRILESSGNVINYLNGIINTPSNETATGPLALSIYVAISEIVTTGADAYTLTHGYQGQHKYIVLKTRVGDATLTPAAFANGSTITFNSVGDCCQLLYTNGSWHYMGGHGCVIA